MVKNPEKKLFVDTRASDVHLVCICMFSMCRAGKQSCFPSSSTSAQGRFELHKNNTDLSGAFSESVEAKKRHKEVFCNFDPLSDALSYQPANVLRRVSHGAVLLPLCPDCQIPPEATR